ncbi:hypothetical protein HYY70_04435 [Candidatus Woesearchaeota archaeon]|nr:hypothetical protein [Candidatus Woesearchaeota archaeon]
MYKMKLWDDDKWNIHSSSYNAAKYSNTISNDKKEGKNYHEQKYGANEKNPGSDYMKKEESREKEEKNASHAFDELDEEKKEQKAEENDIQNDIQFKAARQIFSESKFEIKKEEARKKNATTIEDAIKKAIEEEKEVIIIDN